MAILFCLIVVALYLLGGRRPVRLLGAPRRWNGRRWRATAFFVGVGMIAVVLSGPADEVARQSFSARTAQLIGLLMVVAPLLVLGAPQPRMQRLIGRPTRSPGSSIWGPVATFVLFSGMVGLAFVPAVYHATAGPGWPRALSQLAVVVLGYLFWSQVIAQPPARCRLSHLGRVAYLSLSSAQLRILGLVLGFAPASFYSVPLVDQQIAAGIVMVPGVLTDLVVLTVCLYLWLAQDERRQLGGSDRGGRLVSLAG
jgi:cytochrome c oxidase assembly factor CtaG